MGILRWVLKPGNANERFENGRLFSERAVMVRSMLLATEGTGWHRRGVAANADEYYRMAWLARSLGAISDSRASEGLDEGVQGNRAKGAAAAEGTTIGVTARESLKQDLPGLTSVVVGLDRAVRVEELSGTSEEPTATDVGLDTEVADSDETAGQHVEQESPHEVGRRKGQLLARISTPSIAIAEGDLTVFEGDEAFVADGDAMGVATQVT